MSKTLKWILIAALGLVVVCVVAVAAFFVLRGGPNLINLVPRAAAPAQPGPQFIPQQPFRQFPGNPFLFPYGGPRRGFGGLGGVFGVGLLLFRLAIPLGFAALVILALFLFLRRPQRTVPAMPMPAAPPAAPTLPCPHCGRGVQADWVACPYCGERLGETPPAE